MEKYVEKGLVRFEFRHFPVNGANATLAAQASECAAQQDGFWAFHDVIYDEWGPDVFGRDNTKRVAQEIGLDTSAFNTCLDRGRVLTHVQSDQNMGLELGVRLTPTVFVNGHRIEGSQDFSVYEQIIEDELTAAGF